MRILLIALALLTPCIGASSTFAQQRLAAGEEFNQALIGQWRSPINGFWVMIKIDGIGTNGSVAGFISGGSPNGPWTEIFGKKASATLIGNTLTVRLSSGSTYILIIGNPMKGRFESAMKANLSGNVSFTKE